ncbi:MAG: ribonuclease P protein component [Patescibacteria group bacterium]
MLAKRARLRTSDVHEVLKKGKAVRLGTLAPHLSMKFLSDTGAFRAAVIVSKSIARSAVARNRVRRAAYRALQALPSLRAARVIFFVQKLPAPPLESVLRVEVEALMQQIH